MTKKTTSKESDTPTTMARAEKAVASVAGTVAEAVVTAARAAQEHVVQPVAEAVGLAKPKQGKTAAGKVMSRNMAAAPAKAGKSKGPAGKKTATALRKNTARSAPRGKR